MKPSTSAVVATALLLSAGSAGAQLTDTCDGLTGYQQPLVAITSVASDVLDQNGLNRKIAEASAPGGAIVPFEGEFITAARIWGFSFEQGGGVIGDCDVDDLTPFDVALYDSVGGVPGSPLQSSEVVAQLTNIGDIAPFTAKRYDFSFDPPLPVSGGSWISFQRQLGKQTPNGNECVFAWLMTDIDGFDALVAKTDEGLPWETLSVNDASLCLEFAQVPVELQSFSVSD